MQFDPPYPNPGNGDVNLAFTAVRGARARLALFDLLGREVTVLFEGRVLPGVRQEVDLDTREFAAGIYFCRLEIGDQILVQKVIVTR